mgnify:CR=1 FL=1|tara:strand:+ start:495 stop:701 length:207 start_codon:yes stop_codon:yes gene_type:complete
MEATQVQKLLMIEDDGTEKEIVLVHLYMPKSEALDLISRYNSESSTSPSIGDARPVLRAILDAIIQSG